MAAGDSVGINAAWEIWETKKTMISQFILSVEILFGWKYIRNIWLRKARMINNVFTTNKNINKTAKHSPSFISLMFWCIILTFIFKVIDREKGVLAYWSTRCVCTLHRCANQGGDVTDLAKPLNVELFHRLFLYKMHKYFGICVCLGSRQDKLGYTPWRFGFSP